jgi:indolepyruvate ferredoxin oxidoreductase
MCQARHERFSMNASAQPARKAIPSSLDERYTLARGRILVSGTQALVRLPMIQRQRDLAAGLNTAGYVSGYRGSPLAGFDREMARARRYLKDSHVVFHPGLNEDMAATAVWGTQQTALFEGARYDGVFAMWYGKGPGVDRSMDVIRHANAAGTNPNGGVLLLVGDDHGAVSSTLPHQSEHNLASAIVPLMSPAGVQEYIEFGLMGFAMSRHAGLWVGFKCQTEIVECSATVDLDPDAVRIVVPADPLPADGLSMRWPDGSHAMEKRLEHKLAAVHAFARANRIDRISGAADGATLGIVSTGKSWLDLRSALAALGISDSDLPRLGIRLLKVGLTWPLEPRTLTEFAAGLDRILVVEEKRPVMEEQIKTLLYDLPVRPRVFGKAGADGAPLLSTTAELNAVSVAAAIVAQFPDGALGGEAETIAALSRKAAVVPAAMKREAYFCSGCPHSISTVVPDGSRASTGIGCHMMVVGMEERATSTFTQMGGEGGAWIGLSPFTDEKHIFVNMGDGTYFHSGLLAIRAGIAAKVNATYKILYNDAVAMTGGQKHDGDVTVPGIVAQLLAEGARQVAVVAEQPERWKGVLPREVSISPRDELDAVQKTLRDVEGVTVLVYDQVCAAEKRRRRKRDAYPVSPRRAFINELVCEGCGDCSAVSNCISVEPKETEFGRKRVINQSSCNTDLSCIKGFCPSFVTIEGGSVRRPASRALRDAGDLPEPVLPAIDGSYAMLLAGIGGTGVITVSAILSQAAHLDGLALVTLDQTGLAQKNGAVTSHIQIAREATALAAPRIGPGASDLVLGFDIVVSASAGSLTTFGKERTRAVLDDHFAPTASFVKDTTIDFRQSATLRQLREASKTLGTVSATKLATALFGDALAANMFLLGHAWQAGLVPISRRAIEDAIDLNGAGVAMNRSAFAWGRRSAVDLEAVLAASGLGVSEEKAEKLADVVARRAAFLTDYQDAAYAARYRTLVESAKAAEHRAGGDGAFADAVARGAFKLMAYKDEYEVARLHRDPAFAKRIAAQFEGDYAIRYHLAPPMLSRIDARTGKPGKISFGAWIELVFGLLRRLKRLRGTRFDPFGRTEERRMERRFVAEYFATVEELCAKLDAANLATAVALAKLPEELRGFGHVKMQAAGRYEKRRGELMAKLRSGALEKAA